MYEDSLTISLLPELDATIVRKGFVAEGWEEVDMNEYGVAKRGHDFQEGSLCKDKGYLTASLAKSGDRLYYAFSYGYGVYGCGHPLTTESGHWCHRNNSPEFVAEAIGNVLRYSLEDDGNLDDAGRKYICNLYKKLKPRISEALR